MDAIKKWKFIGPDGSFSLQDAQQTSYLYFPLVNEAGMVSVVTPSLHGDAKTDQHTFLLPPASVEDLHTSRASRSFWVSVEGLGSWSAAGNAAAQRAHPEPERVTLHAGLLWQKFTRFN